MWAGGDVPVPANLMVTGGLGVGSWGGEGVARHASGLGRVGYTVLVGA
jgi:hypothetical protein